MCDVVFDIHNGSGAIAFESDYNPYEHIIINAKTIKLHQKDLDIVIDISKDILDKIENIEINGHKFISEGLFINEAN